MLRYLPQFDETAYYGHRDRRYAESQSPNFARVQMYKKVKDDGKDLHWLSHRVRMEVTLEQEGCRHFGVYHLRDLYGFSFRRFAPYFYLAEPSLHTPGGSDASLPDAQANRMVGEALDSLTRSFENSAPGVQRTEEEAEIEVLLEAAWASPCMLKSAEEAEIDAILAAALAPTNSSKSESEADLEALLGAIK